MEARLSEVEKAIVRIDGRFELIFDRMDSTKVDMHLWRTESRVAAREFKYWTIGSVIVIVTAVVATAVGIQQMTVATFQAASQQAVSPPPQVTINNVQPASNTEHSAGRPPSR